MQVPVAYPRVGRALDYPCFVEGRVRAEPAAGLRPSIEPAGQTDIVHNKMPAIIGE
jgi:hypothetical protein